MLRGLYTATSGMMAQQRRHDTITNNIANLNTPGFKAENPMIRSFPEYLIQRVGETPRGSIAPKLGRIAQGVFVEEKVPTFVQGDLNETGNMFDFALVSNLQVEDAAFDRSGKFVSEDGEVIFQPQAFFTVLDENGQRRYTRGGKFVVDSQGQVVTPSGHKVLGVNGEPILMNGRADIKIDKQGNVYDNLTGLRITDVQPFLISRVENPNKLVREGHGVFSLGEDEEVRPVERGDLVEIHQKHLERSNVDPTQSMVEMMTAMRAYEANQKVIQFYDRSLEKAVNDVGRVY